MTGAPSNSYAHGSGAGRHLPRDTLALWFTLRRLPGVGTRTQHELLEQFGSVENIFAASRGQLDKLLAGKHEAGSFQSADGLGGGDAGKLRGHTATSRDVRATISG